MNERKPYSSDLTDVQWQQIEPLIPAVKSGGRPARYSRREIINAVLYVTRNGCAWRNLPHDLPPWSLVYNYFWRWQQDGTWQTVHDHLVGELRQKTGRNRLPSAARNRLPSAALLDSQSVKTTEKSVKTTEKGGLAAMTVASASRGVSAILS